MVVVREERKEGLGSSWRWLEEEAEEELSKSLGILWTRDG